MTGNQTSLNQMTGNQRFEGFKRVAISMLVGLVVGAFLALAFVF
jgi:hypothetical protein